MAHYLVRARPRWEKLSELRARLDGGEISLLRPFGPTLHDSLCRARVEEDGTAVWEEEDYCSPPLRQEREAVLDEFFDDVSVKAVTVGHGWAAIDALPVLWNEPRA